MRDPLFILAPPGSFGSLLCAMIGQHPQMYDLPRVNLFAGETYQDLSGRYGNRSHMLDGLLRAVAELVFGSQTSEAAEMAQEWLQEDIQADTASIYRELVERAAPKSVVDASCTYVSDPDALLRMRNAFPNARYLHLLRHPASTCESIYASFPRRRPSPDKLWLFPHLDIIEFLEGIPSEQHVQLRMEDLLADPEVYLKQIAEWLEVRTSAQCIAAMLHPERSRFAVYGPANAKFGNDPDFLKNPILTECLTDRLACPLSWDPDLIFSDETKQYARLFGFA